MIGFEKRNVNPKNRKTPDCVVRALTVATGKAYADVYRELFDVSLATGYMLNEKRVEDKVLASNGFVKHKQPRKANNTKYTGKEFCLKIAKKNVRYVANIGGRHIVAIVNGKVNDIWDSTGGCIGNYWTK